MYVRDEIEGTLEHRCMYTRRAFDELGELHLLLFQVGHAHVKLLAYVFICPVWQQLFVNALTQLILWSMLELVVSQNEQAFV
jgi:hypothetical protein